MAASAKVALSSLCSVLAAIGIRHVDPESLRKAKFNDASVVRQQKTRTILVADLAITATCAYQLI